MPYESSTASPRVRRKRAARRLEILSVALEVVETRGLDALTIKGLADQLDYAVGALYRYFPSKSALVGDLQREVVAGLDGLHASCRQRGLAAAEAAGASPVVRALLPALVTAAVYRDFARRAPGPFGLISLSLGDPRHLIEDDQARSVLEAAAPIFERIAADMDRAAELGALAEGDGMDRAIALWAAIHGVAQLHKLERSQPERIEVGRLSESVVEALLAGWGASPGSIRRASRLLTESDPVELPDPVIRLGGSPASGGSGESAAGETARDGAAPVRVGRPRGRLRPVRSR